MNGIYTESNKDTTFVTIHTVKCDLALGRLIFLILVTVIWLYVALFLLGVWMVGKQLAPACFALLFFISFLFLLILCVAAVGSETIAIGRNDLIFSKRIWFATWQKRLEGPMIQAIVLGRLSRPGEDAVSIETVSVVYSTRQSLIVGYLLGANYRRCLYNLLVEIIEQRGLA
jgi:hypothetical protein